LWKVHSALGPGLLEGVYEKCLAHELERRSLKVARQVFLPVVYDGMVIEGSYRIDLLIENTVVVELKVSEGMSELHKAQLLSYLKLSNSKSVCSSISTLCICETASSGW
jgi:GxxExxY protein